MFNKVLFIKSWKSIAEQIGKAINSRVVDSRGHEEIRGSVTGTL